MWYIVVLRMTVGISFTTFITDLKALDLITTDFFAHRFYVRVLLLADFSRDVNEAVTARGQCQGHTNEAKAPNRPPGPSTTHVPPL